jgi:hypothetical protein
MSDEEDEFIGLSLAYYQFNNAEIVFDSDLEDAGFKRPMYSKFWMDDYDNSVEFGKVENDFRMGEALQRFIFKHGFSRAYVNHQDGWETFYTWKGKEFELSRGWRRRYVTDPSAATTRQVGTPSDPEHRGYYEISYWPDGWDKGQDWLKTGYMRIVPDPLEAVGVFR